MSSPFSSLTSGGNSGCVGKGFGQAPRAQRSPDSGRGAVSPEPLWRAVQERQRVRDPALRSCRPASPRFSLCPRRQCWGRRKCPVYIWGLHEGGQAPALGFSAPVRLQCQSEVLSGAWHPARFLSLSMVAPWASRLCSRMGLYPPQKLF